MAERRSAACKRAAWTAIRHHIQRRLVVRVPRLLQLSLLFPILIFSEPLGVIVRLSLGLSCHLLSLHLRTCSVSLALRLGIHRYSEIHPGGTGWVHTSNALGLAPLMLLEIGVGYLLAFWARHLEQTLVRIVSAARRMHLHVLEELVEQVIRAVVRHTKAG